MGIAYRKDEILSASRVARSFGKVLTALKSREKQRVAVAKNNTLEAVILPIQDYEAMAEALDLLEHIEIHRIVAQRKRSAPGRRVSLDTLLREERIAL